MNQNQQSQNKQTDIIGILSIVAPFVGLGIVGIFLGYIGMNKAKKDNYPDTLSKTGFTISVILTLFFAAFFLIMVGLSISNNS